MTKTATLITGANGEIGHGLIEAIARDGDRAIVAVDLHPIDGAVAAHCEEAIQGDILDDGLLTRLGRDFAIEEIHHLAAMLSTSAEKDPARAHRVNVGGTVGLLELARAQAERLGRAVPLLFPSSIAAYGLPDRAAKERAGRVREEEWNLPATIYGCNKLACEHLGRYYTFHYRRLDPARPVRGVDFRAIRFPGLISAATLPSGGTSDYGPEMIHAAAKGEPYACFVDEGARLPFMAMPDAVKALRRLAAAPAERLRTRVYNVTSFSLTAGEIRDRVLRHFPGARITFEPDAPRAAIVETWPGDVDDGAAREDWGWAPDLDADRAFDEYLVPAIARRYRGGVG